MDNSKPNKIETQSSIVQQIAAGNFSARAPISDTQDEIDGLSMGINMLAEELQKRENDLSLKLKELTDLNQLFVNRELKMVELKDQVKVLQDEVAVLKEKVS